MITRPEADAMGLRFLRDNGPHTIGRIEDDGALAAFMCFLDLEKRGHVSSTDFGNGQVQFAITAAGRAALEQS